MKRTKAMAKSRIRIELSRCGEETEAYMFAHLGSMGFSHGTIDAAIDELVDAGKVKSTVIQARNEGNRPGRFYAALMLVR